MPPETPVLNAEEEVGNEPSEGSLSEEELAEEQAFSEGFEEEDESSPGTTGQEDGNVVDDPAPAAEAAPAGDDELSPEPAEPSDETDDPWAGVAPGMRGMLEEMRTSQQALYQQMTETSEVANRAAGRVSHLQSQLATGQAPEPTGGAPAPPRGEIAAALKSSAKLKELIEDVPEVGEAVQEGLTLMHQDLQTQFQEQTRQLVTEAEARADRRAQHLVDTERLKVRVERKHEGWEDTVRTPEFGTWLQGQPPDVRALSDSDQPSDAIQMLDRFGDHVKKQRARAQREQRLAENVTPSGTGARAATRRGNQPTEEEDFAAGWNEA